MSIFGELPPAVQSRLENITAHKNWSFEDFKKVNLALVESAVRTPHYVPAFHAPDSIHLQGFRPQINLMWERTLNTGHERGMAIFVDKEKQNFVQSPIYSGDKNSVGIPRNPQPGRERFQVMVGAVHTHPITDRSLGFSDVDYQSFLMDPKMHFEILVYESVILLALKTSVTPVIIEKGVVTRSLSESINDFFVNGQGTISQRLVRFNKNVCMENGLTLFMADSNSKDLLNRVSVIK